jgi:hypothetical protein
MDMWLNGVSVGDCMVDGWVVFVWVGKWWLGSLWWLDGMVLIC